VFASIQGRRRLPPRAQRAFERLIGSQHSDSRLPEYRPLR
jgi:hypothetical protein